MKWRIRIGLGVVLLGASMLACDEPAAPSSQTFEIHLQTFFQGNWVHLKLDDRAVFDGVTTTEPQIGLAAVLHASAAKGPHVAWVAVDGMEKVVQFDLQDPVYVLVRFDPQGLQPAITITAERPQYE